MISPEMRRPEVFDAGQPVPADAPVADRLLAFAGRKIWRHGYAQTSPLPALLG